MTFFEPGLVCLLIVENKVFACIFSKRGSSPIPFQKKAGMIFACNEPSLQSLPKVSHKEEIIPIFNPSILAIRSSSYIFKSTYNKFWELEK